MTDDATSALRAVAHPVRLRILSLLTGTELSAAEVARELDLTHANASYHLRVLLDAGQLEIASEERIRGGVAKRYRHPWQQAVRTGRRRATAEDRQLYARAMAEELVRRTRLARLDGASAWSTDAELWVTPAVYDAVRATAHEVSMTLHGAALPPRTEGSIRVAFSASLFEMEPDTEPDGS